MIVSLFTINNGHHADETNFIFKVIIGVMGLFLTLSAYGSTGSVELMKLWVRQEKQKGESSIDEERPHLLCVFK